VLPIDNLNRSLSINTGENASSTTRWYFGKGRFSPVLDNITNDRQDRQAADLEKASTEPEKQAVFQSKELRDRFFVPHLQREHMSFQDASQRLSSEQAYSFQGTWAVQLKELLSQQEANSVTGQARRNLDLISPPTAATSDFGSHTAASGPAPENTGKADQISTTGWKHLLAAQEFRRLQGTTKPKQGWVAKKKGARVLAKVVTSVTADQACGECSGGLGLACSSQGIIAPQNSTVFGSVDNTTYNFVTVGKIHFTHAPIDEMDTSETNAQCMSMTSE
jgi:hypothetical protein